MPVSVWVILGVLVLCTAFGLIWKRRSGVFVESISSDRPELVELGVDPSTSEVTLLQFSSSICAYCRAARELCTQLAAETPDVRHVEVDAEHHLETVRALGIMRTPTILVLDRSGAEKSRASGPPDRTGLTAAVAAVINQAKATQ